MRPLYCFLLLLICSSVFAAEFMPKAFKAEFDQSFKSVVRKKVVIQPGILHYQYPGNIRFEITDPEEGLVYVSNSSKTWYYRPPFIPGEPGELSVSPQGNTLVAKFFDGLKNGLKNNDFYKSRDLGEGKFELAFNAKSVKEMGIKKSILYFKGQVAVEKVNFSLIEKMDITFKDDKEVTLVFKKVNGEEKLDDQIFTFKAPENTNISTN